MLSLRRCPVLFGSTLAAALAGCAATDDVGDAEEDAASDVAALGSAQTLSDEDAVAQTNRGDCNIKTGDLIFHRSQSEQAGAIAYLTRSELTHVGVVFKLAGTWSVYEAVGPVKLTPLDTWIARGQGRRFATSRVENGLSASRAKALFEAGKPFYGKPYDLLFTSDDANIYCSELVLKMYERSSTSWLGFLWPTPYSRLWGRVNRLDGWADFQADLARPADSSGEKLVKRIMAARGIEVGEFASQTLVAPVTLSSESQSGGAFQSSCSFGSH